MADRAPVHSRVHQARGTHDVATLPLALAAPGAPRGPGGRVALPRFPAAVTARTRHLERVGSVAIRNSSIRFLRYVGAKRRVDTRHCGRAILEILIATEPMKTHQNSFNIDYSASLSNWRFLGSATIARLPTVDFKGRSAKSGYLQSFSTEEQALGHALCWAQRWCDEN
jgi:hypothetical protein